MPSSSARTVINRILMRSRSNSLKVRRPINLRSSRRSTTPGSASGIRSARKSLKSSELSRPSYDKGALVLGKPSQGRSVVAASGGRSRRGCPSIVVSEPPSPQWEGDQVEHEEESDGEEDDEEEDDEGEWRPSPREHLDSGIASPALSPTLQATIRRPRSPQASQSGVTRRAKLRNDDVLGTPRLRIKNRRPVANRVLGVAAEVLGQVIPDNQERQKRQQQLRLLKVPQGLPLHGSKPKSSPSTPRSQQYLDNFCELFANTKHDTVLGKGSFGCVFLSAVRENKVAAKICPQALCSCIGETNALLLRHPNVVRTYRVLQCDEPTMQSLQNNRELLSMAMNVLGKPQFVLRGMQIAVMEYAGNLSLQKLLDSDSVLATEDRGSILLQISDGLDYLHSLYIAHLDLKPANIVLNEWGACKLVDFGCSRRLVQDDSNSHTHTESKQLTGTVAYIAPENFRGAPPTLNCDIYSLGIIMWQLVSREVPYSGMDAAAIIYQVVKKELRPSFDTYAMDCDWYSRTARNCWLHDPDARPTSRQLLSLLKSHTCQP